MKNIFSTMSIVFLSVTGVLAQNSNGFLKIRLSDFSPISIVIDQRFYNEENSVITIRNFPSGRHYLRVFRWSEREQRNIPVFEGEIFFQSGVISSMVIDRRSGFARINNRRIGRDYGNEYVYDWERNEHYRDQDNWSNENNTHGNNGFYNKQQNNQGNTTNNNRESYYNNNSGNSFGNSNINYGNSAQNNWNNIPSQGANMTAQDLNDLHTRIADRITDTDKLKLLQSVLNNRIINTNQAIQIIDWLNFESTRLEFAKWIYGYIIDKNNFWKIESEFTFESTKSEFNDFLNEKANH